MQLTPFTNYLTASASPYRRRIRWLAALAVASATLLTVAPLASGDPGVVGRYEFPVGVGPGQLGGVFGGGGIGGVAVNHDGTGGAEPGRLYALDGGEGQAISRLQWFSRGGDFLNLTPINTAEDIAIDQETGNVYLTGGGSVEVRSASGDLMRVMGFDVVRSGPDDSAVDETQKLTVIATAGTFTLAFGPFPAKTTSPLPYNASAAAVQSALDALQTIGGAGGSVSVTGGPAATSPLEITFGGALGGDDVPQISGSDVNLSGAGRKAEITTVSAGGATESCLSPSDLCKEGVASGGNGTINPESIAIAPASAPNAGNVLIAEGTAKRVTEYSSANQFLRTFGWDVDQTNPSTGFEECTAISGDVCKEGTTGSNLGQFSGNLRGIAVDSTGSVYVADSSDSSAGRVQKFTPAGPVLTPSVFGKDEVQDVTVNATGGTFRLGLDGQVGGTRGRGDTTNGSNVVTNVNTLSGRFVVGRPFADSGVGGYGFPPRTVITDVGGNSLTLSRPTNLSEEDEELISDLPYTTVDLPFDATPVQVETALNALPPVTAAPGGSVTVTGGPSGAYQVSFNGGGLKGTAMATISGEDGSTPLVGGTEPGANEAVVATIEDGGPNGVDQHHTPVDVAVDEEDHVFVTQNMPANGMECPDGSPQPEEVLIREFEADGTWISNSTPCLAIAPHVYSTGLSTHPGSVGNLFVDPIDGRPFLAHQGSSVFGGLNNVSIHAFVFAELGPTPALTLNPPSGLTASGVRISGTINPQGPLAAAGLPNPTATTYRVEFKRSSDSDWQQFAPEATVGSGTSPVPFDVGVSGLTPKTTYDIRVIATKRGLAPQRGPIQTIVTAGAPPTVETFSSSEVTQSTANLHAVLNAQGTDTTYHFEYGTTPAYGSSTPEVSIGESLTPVEVEQQISSLESSVYHFRVVATNTVGTTTSSDQTFTFYPESCPNAAVRQQTSSDGLPDCRAYELVSPGDTGSGVALVPGGPMSAVATSPSRFSYLGELGSIEGVGPTTGENDIYVATRHVTGWDTKYIGFPANVTGTRGLRNGSAEGLLSDEGLTKFLGWKSGGALVTSRELPGYAPTLFDSEGQIVRRLPTNVDEVAGAGGEASQGFVGDGQLSADGRHYVFSSAILPFAPGGLSGEGGSVYDNDIDAETVTVVSKLMNGAPIPREPGNDSTDYLKVPAVSRDGSHILIAAAATGLCGKAKCTAPPDICGTGLPNEFGGLGLGLCPTGLSVHLYMRVDSTFTYDVTRGHTVDLEGMTVSGDRVFFTSTADLTEDDSDSDRSRDLYMWSEVDDSVTRVSSGVVEGNTDGCNADWTSACDVEVPDTGHADSSFASATGDIYFYSPEQLVPGKGIPGRRNLFVWRPGGLQFVTTLAADRPLARLQVSPNGAYAGFTTASKVTNYDNTAPDGVCSEELPIVGPPIPRTGPKCLEMYRYRADDGDIQCVSCLPSGDPPSNDVLASKAGLFMTFDGRTFFSTADAVVPRDTNGTQDVYEFVEGRPQLITSGVGGNNSLYAENIGLAAVSGDGTDVYFSTLDTLVSEDQNGPFLKIYDARTGGGFAHTAEIAPCAAADECHGATGAAPQPSKVISTASLSSGNVRSGHQKKKHRRKHRKRGRRNGHSRHPNHEKRGATR
jgi:hypothetical protein